MNDDLFFQQQYYIDDQLTQTFGRKPLKKYIKQHDFNDNLQQPKKSYNIIYHKDDSPLMTFRETQYSQTKNTNRNILNNQQKLSKIQSNHQLESIDRINKKINGLINSISASCEKQKIISSANKYQNDLPANKKSIFQDLTIERDRQLTQKKKSNPYCQKVNIKPYFLFFKQRVQNQVKMATNNQQNNDYDQKQFDSLDDRIQRISYKIQEHEKKRKKQQSDRMPYALNQMSYKNQNNANPLKSQRELSDNKFFDNERVNKTLKKGNYINNNMTNYEKPINGLQNINKQNRIYRKEKLIGEAKQFLFQKGGYFKEKYKQLKIAGKQECIKMQHDKNVRHIKTNAKTDYSQSGIDTKENSKRKIKQQEEIVNFPLKNVELLSYKTTFMKQIVKQIQLDQDFRHAKHMFGGIDNLFDEDNHNIKWNILQTQLSKQGFSLDIHEVKEIFMPRDDEIDPFMSIHNSHQELIYGVIYAYQITEKHWNQSIYHSWTLWQLKEAKFNSQNLDLERKGYITVEDLTFYVNTQVDGYFRNRDLLLIFYRLSDSRSHLRKQPKNGTKFKQMMDRLLSR